MSETTHRTGISRPGLLPALLLAVCLSFACDDSSSQASFDQSTCSIPESEIFSGGVPKDGIPALTDPPLVTASEVAYLGDNDRIIGLLMDDDAIAIPHNILWWHEIVNLSLSIGKVAVSYCPLTGSSIAFMRDPVDGAEFGVSGLLFQNNLIMYDRNDQESLWPQMALGARCGRRLGSPLVLYPIVEMTWAGWRELYPSTLVIGEQTGHARNYRAYPYSNLNYESLDSRPLFPQDNIDPRRPIKERTLAIPNPDGGGLAFPFNELDEGGPLNAVHADVNGIEVVVFWDRSRQSAMAYHPRSGGQNLSFSIRDNAIRDTETGSSWQVDGSADEGSLAGTRLEPVDEAIIAFWFAWPAFYPDIRLWEN